MSTRSILTGFLLASVLLATRTAGAGETAPTPAAAAGPSSSPEVGAQQFVQGLYMALSRGSQDAHRPLADAIDAEALLERVMTGLSAPPPAEWRAAALARLEGSREAMAKAMARAAARSMVRALPAQPGPDGTTRVAARLYLFSEQGGLQTGWHRLTLHRTGDKWRVVEVEMLDSGDQISNLALATLCDPEKEPLPTGNAARALAIPLLELVVCMVVGLALGLALRAMLARRQVGASGDRGSGTVCVVIGAIAGTVLGLIFFGIGMVGFLGQRGAIDELQQRIASFTLLKKGNVDGALKLWKENRMAQTLRAGFLAAQANPGEAAAYLEALAQTESPPPAVYLNLSRLQEQAKSWSQAAASRIKFSEILGGDALVYCEAARDLARSQDLKGSEQLLAMAEKAEPPDFRILMVRAEAHAAARKAAAVVADFKALLASREMVIEPREVAALLEQAEEYKAVKGDAAVKAFLQELKSGADETPVGPIRR